MTGGPVSAAGPEEDGDVSVTASGGRFGKEKHT